MTDLLSILQEKLGLDRSAVESQLRSYVDYALARSVEPTGMEIQDLGTFRLTGDQLTFEPEDILVAAVNYKYRTLAPLTVRGGEILALDTPFKEGHDLSSLANQRDDLLTTDHGDEDPAGRDTEVGADIDADVDADVDENADAVTDEFSNTAELAEIEDRSQASETAIEHVIEESYETASAAQAASPPQTASAPHVASVPVREDLPKPAPTRKRNVRLVAVIGLVAVVVAVAIAMVRSDDSNLSPSDELREPVSAIGTDANGTAESGNSSTAAVGSADDGSATDRNTDGGNAGSALIDDPVTGNADDGNSDETPETVVPRPDPASSALPNRPSGRTYSIIVGSTQTESQAQVHVAGLPETGYPSAITPYERDGSTGYRISIGFFSTVTEADSVRLSLSDQLPPGSWIFRIQ